MRLVQSDMERVNATILSRTGSDVELIPELAHHLISSGGKRLRPMLTIAAAKLCGYRGDGHIKLAAAVEFMHTATLLHDDVVDESDLRRGKPTARMLWGNQASVLVGDFLLGQAFRMMVEVGSLRCSKILSNAAAVIAEGEVMQLAAAKNTTTTEDDYLAIINAKTAALFSAAAEVGADRRPARPAEQAALQVLRPQSRPRLPARRRRARLWRPRAKLGKSVGDDFREGKITLPVILAFRAAAPTTSARSGSARIEKRRDQRRRSRARVGLMNKHGAIEATLERAAPLRRHRPRCARHRSPSTPLKRRCSRRSTSPSTARTEGKNLDSLPHAEEARTRRLEARPHTVSG